MTVAWVFNEEALQRALREYGVPEWQAQAVMAFLHSEAAKKLRVQPMPSQMEKEAGR